MDELRYETGAEQSVALQYVNDFGGRALCGRGQSARSVGSVGGESYSIEYPGGSSCGHTYDDRSSGAGAGGCSGLIRDEIGRDARVVAAVERAF